MLIKNKLTVFLFFLSVLLFNSTVAISAEVTKENKQKLQPEIKKENVAEELDLKLNKYHQARKNFLNKSDSTFYLVTADTTATDESPALGEQKNRMDHFKDSNLSPKQKNKVNFGIGTEFHE